METNVTYTLNVDIVDYETGEIVGIVNNVWIGDYQKLLNSIIDDHNYNIVEIVRHLDTNKKTIYVM